MLSYHNDPKLKESVLRQLQKHQEQDNFIQGHYWREGKGCAVGCLLGVFFRPPQAREIPNMYHIRYETNWGIPRQLAILEDHIFEALSIEEAKSWPLEFMGAIPVGVELSVLVEKWVTEMGVIKFPNTITNVQASLAKKWLLDELKLLTPTEYLTKYPIQPLSFLEILNKGGR